MSTTAQTIAQSTPRAPFNLPWYLRDLPEVSS
jgi:methane/ammonia monooxygenase subunit C